MSDRTLHSAIKDRDVVLRGTSTSGGGEVHFSQPKPLCLFQECNSDVTTTARLVLAKWAPARTFAVWVCGEPPFGQDSRVRSERLREVALKHVQQTDDDPSVEALLSELRGTTAPDRLGEIEDALTDAPIRSERLESIFENRAEGAHVRAAALRAVLQRKGSPALVLAGLSDPETRVRAVAADASSDWTGDEAVRNKLREIREKDRSRLISEIAADVLDASI